MSTPTPETFQPLALADDLNVSVDGLQVRAWSGRLNEFVGGTVFGMVTERTEVNMGEHPFILQGGAYFVAPQSVRVEGGQRLALCVPSYRGLPQVGGPIEHVGRLQYIDGCTDTLLVCPPRLGEPCLNHLHIPSKTTQTAHIHTSVRVGVIARGRGLCRTERGEHLLSAGMGWVIPAGLRHCFITADSPLDVIAWHPDSDFGPTDENHPMKNRTVV